MVAHGNAQPHVEQSSRAVVLYGILSERSGYPEGLSKCFLLTLRCTNNNDHHSE